jgi:hypothetical protein
MRMVQEAKIVIHMNLDNGEWSCIRDGNGTSTPVGFLVRFSEAKGAQRVKLQTLDTVWRLVRARI